MKAPGPRTHRRRRQVAHALLGAAVGLTALVAHALYVATPAQGPAVWLPATLAAACVAAHCVVARRRAALFAAAVAFVVFVANARRMPSGDTRPAALLPYALVRHGTLSLDDVVSRPLPYWAVEARGRTWSQYPVTAGLLALPVYLPAAIGPGPLDYPPAEKLAAALLAAGSVGFVLATLRRLDAPPWLAATATALYAAGSPVLVNAAQALYQHSPAVLGVAGATWAVLRAREAPGAAWVAGVMGGLAVAARPTAVLVVAPLAALAATAGVGALARFVAGASVPAAAVALYQQVAFGAPWRTGYGFAATQLRFDGDASAGLLGLVASPARGLVPFVPWALLSLVGFALAWSDRRQRAFALGCAATIALYSKWPMWWGGWCFGPRFLTETMPFLAFGLVPLARLPRRGVVAALALTGSFAVALHVAGAYSSNHPVMRASRDLETAQQAMEWRRFPPVSILRGAAPR